MIPIHFSRKVDRVNNLHRRIITFARGRAATSRRISLRSPCFFPDWNVILLVLARIVYFVVSELCKRLAIASKIIR